MTVERYMEDLGAALNVRGSVRRRFLRECRDHLADAAAACGEAAAVRAFGPAEEVAAAFDAEVAVRRGVRATFATAAGVLGVGASTLALIHAASSDTQARVAWAITFFIAAQLAGTAAALGLLQALGMRRRTAPPAEVMLLTRRNACALVAAGVTMFAAGAAVPGEGSALLLLAGPVLASGAFVAVLRTRALTRRLAGARARAIHRPLPSVSPATLLALTTATAACAAFARDRGEHATVAAAFLTAGIEAAAVVACFVTLGPALGLWRPRS